MWKKPAPSCRFKCQWGNCGVCCEAKRWEFLSRCGCSEAKPFHWFVQMIEHSIMESCLLHSVSGGNDGVLSAATWCNPCITLGASFVLLRWPLLQLCHSPRGLCQTGPSWQGVRVDGGLRTIRDITGIQYLSWLIAGSKTKEILKSQDGVRQRRFAQEMKDLEVPPSVVTYSSAMHAWTKARLVTKTDSSWVVTIRTPVNIQ